MVKEKLIWHKYERLLDNLQTNNFYLVKPNKNSLSSYHILALIFYNLKEANLFKNFMQKKEYCCYFSLCATS